MKFFKKLGNVAGMVAAAAICLALAEQARAVFTLSGTTAELVSRGINADFETPAQARGDGESTSTNNMGAGWNFSLISGVSNNFGVADPNNTFYGTVATGPLPAPFEGLQLGFYNLNNPFSHAEIVSNPIGILRAGETYTLNIGVGIRNLTSTAMNQIAYRVGLRATDGTDIGPFATTVVVPTAGAGVITNLLYTLDMNTAPSFVGSTARIVIGGYNTGNNNLGAYTNQNAQPNFDNVRLAGTFDDLVVVTPPTASLSINRQTGATSLSNTSASNLNIAGYTLTSTNGAFDQANWSSIANTYDQPSSPTPGNGSVDSDDPWTILSASGSKTDLSEEELSGGNGGTLSTSTPINLGNAWRRTPFQDVAGQLLLADGSAITATVQYSGVAIPSGDLNGDALINGADWTLFKSGQGTNFTGMSKAESYLKGDLTGNLTHDLGDFFAFRTAYDASNGAGSFEGLLSNVPEPGTGLLLGAFGVVTLAGLRVRHQRRGVFSMNRISKMMIVAVVAATACVLTAQPAAAQTGVAHWSFDSSTLTIDSGNITGVAEKTNNHNAAPGFGGTGGGTGTAFVSQAFPSATSSVTGQFGNAMRFAGNNFLLFPNLTEIMEGTDPANAPSYTVSMWYKMETPGATVGSAYAHLGNWGNKHFSAPDPGAGTTRFTYGFGPHDNTHIRGQTRRTNAGSGNGGTDGSDIYAPGNVVIAGINNGNWHMLTWTFNTDTGQLISYYDNAAVLTTQAAAAAGPDYAMANSNSLVGGMGIKADSGTFVPVGSMLDEVYVFTGALSPAQIGDLYNLNQPPPGAFPEPIFLTLRVDPATGQAQLRNDSAGDVTFNAYRITSSTGALNQAGWDAISTGTPVSGFPQGNGSGNGWEVPPGASNPADYNGDGKVDGADYVTWRETNINGAAGYTTWRTNFGATGGVGGSDNELVEWYLTGDSTLAVGQSVSLGQAFDIGGAQNLAFQFTTSTGVRSGMIEYATIGSGNVSAAVPEPASGWLLVVGCGFVACVWRRRNSPCLVIARVAACLVVTSISATSAVATVTNDRIYRLGENGVPVQTQENAVAGQPVGSGIGNPAPGNTLDHIGPTGSFQVLLAGANAGGALPVYQDLSTVGTGRTGLGVLFDGTDDFLNGFSLGFPPLSRGTINGGGTGTLNYNGVYQRGYQLWVYPHSGATLEQHVVSDTTEHGVRITSGGNWMLRHSGTNVNSNVPVTFNQWAHVMATMPDNSQPHKGVLYVNGVALAVQAENYDTTATVNAQALIVGANTDANGTLVGTTNFFRGVLDELEIFIWGRGYNHLTDTYTDFGSFNFATDNGYAASQLTGVPGDINSSGGALNQADIDAFVAGWLFEKKVNGIRVGDLVTFAKGDVNFDGITNVTDMALFRDAIGGAGSGAGFDLTAFNSLGVPEPSSIALALILFGLWGSCRRHGRNSA